MSADPTLPPAPTPPRRSIPVSSPSDPEPPRFRWVAPLFIGIAVGAVIGCGVTFTMITLSTRTSSGDLVAERFQIHQVLTAANLTDQLTVGSDNTSHLGTSGRRSGSGTAVRRKIELSGSVKGAGASGNLAALLKNQVDGEITRAGAFSSGGSSSSSSGGNEHRGTYESQYYTRDGRQGQMDMEVRATGDYVKVTITLFEAR